MKQLVFIIQYIIDADRVNTEQLIDNMNEYGEAKIIDVKVKEVEKEIKK